MKISWGCSKPLDKLGQHNGYGYATKNAVASLRRLGHEVNYSTSDADVHIHFDQPQFFQAPREDIYKIIFLPWESTRLKPKWKDALNKVDEVWTPSPLIAKWYRTAGVRTPIHVYQHGVEPLWAPKKRVVQDKVRFLHLGVEASRKGGLDVMRAMGQAFGRGSKDVELTLKMVNPGWRIPTIGNINIVNTVMSEQNLVELFHSHHVYTYPSWGEGFGLTPLQAMATGMPTITVPDWAPYATLLDERLTLDAKLHASQWPLMHPGKMFAPNQDDLVDKMRWVVDNYESASEYALDTAPHVLGIYDWDKLTDRAFRDLEHRLKITQKL
jgi:glycosyltransferase involved in cell wall biosynthesis